MEGEKMDLVSIGLKIGKGIKSLAGALMNEALNNQQKVKDEMDRSYNKAKQLSDEELKEKVRKAYKEEGKRDMKTLGMAREFVEREKRQE